MKKTFPTIYKRTAKGQVQVWTIISEGGAYHAEEGIQGGTISINDVHTCEPKNPGKKNATTAADQAVIEAQAKWEKKLKTGYSETLAGIDTVKFEKPMKGEKWKDFADKVIFPIQVQMKLNGVRSQNDAESTKSTGGEIFYTIPHIRKALAPIFEAYPQIFLDGEHFNFDLRQKLNRLVHLVSVVYKPKDLTPELLSESEALVQLHLFDGYGFEGITQETPWVERHAAIEKLIKQFKPKYVFVLPYKTMHTPEELSREMIANKKTGGEGLMIRWGTCPVKKGRSKYMLKAKHFEDQEFVIEGFEEGNGAWASCVKAVICKLNKVSPRGDTNFRSNIEGDEAWLRELWQNRKKYIGEQATVEYQCLSEYGIPQIPFVRAIRNYE
jgi:hypothetical protein